MCAVMLSDTAISIHALFAEGDQAVASSLTGLAGISIHALFAEGDAILGGHLDGQSVNFYPRPLRRGRPPYPPGSCTRSRAYFYPRPLRRGRHYGTDEHGKRDGISIHALFAEGDGETLHPAGSHPKFLSTPSSQRATVGKRAALRRNSYFYPRPLRRGRLLGFEDANSSEFDFYPRPLRRGRLAQLGRLPADQGDFYPRPLRRGRPPRRWTT